MDGSSLAVQVVGAFIRQVNHFFPRTRQCTPASLTTPEPDGSVSVLMNTEVSSDSGEKYMKMDITVLAMGKDGVQERGGRGGFISPVRVLTG